ncbi:MarC family protein [Aestuariirhabdus sp. Z084]|uniref:MarC family protein n=1 Tax=Aestuariirhabdus haliotis TaxID=2918751 RepID=UPI00201B3925|nr:NAAT family transporter [Aestuariirhabdus haliotis]MCL6415568.1 MarC family protein [Aestuariirhabdus haliotis]MCL6419227.1 MarC family protein [Aestuariirhabdus haliotis]
MPNELLEFFLLCLTSLFTMINPLSVTPIFTSMTSQLDRATARRVAGKATLTAAIILILFAVTGQFIFKIFSITVDSLRIVGGVIFFIMGYEMIQARLSKIRFDKDNLHEMESYTQDIAITPIAIPLIAGPGAIASVIILMSSNTGLVYHLMLFSSIALVALVTYVFLLFSTPIMDRLGESGNKVLLRIMGLIVMVIGVEFFVGGLTPIVRNMLMIQA